MLDYQIRDRIRIGMEVVVRVKKNGNYTGETEKGYVLNILTKTSEHCRGIKVTLTSGTVGRICEICE